MPRKLNLRVERLSELATDELAEVVAGDNSLHQCLPEILDRLLYTRRPTQCWCP